MPDTHYRARPLEIEAIQWTGHDACAAVHAFAGLPIPERCDHDSIVVPVHADAIGTETAWIGHWIIRYPGGWCGTLRDHEFREDYEAVNPDGPELAWGEIVVQHPQHGQVRIPLSGENGSDAGVLVLDRQQSAVLGKMLRDLDGSDD